MPQFIPNKNSELRALHKKFAELGVFKILMNKIKTDKWIANHIKGMKPITGTYIYYSIHTIGDEQYVRYRVYGSDLDDDPLPMRMCNTLIDFSIYITPRPTGRIVFDPDRKAMYDRRFTKDIRFMLCSLVDDVYNR